eukprot:285792-Pleurochrysis_carterae.AAC.4
MSHVASAPCLSRQRRPSAVAIETTRACETTTERERCTNYLSLNYVGNNQSSSSFNLALPSIRPAARVLFFYLCSPPAHLLESFLGNLYPFFPPTGPLLVQLPATHSATPHAHTRTGSLPQPTPRTSAGTCAPQGRRASRSRPSSARASDPLRPSPRRRPASARSAAATRASGLSRGKYDSSREQAHAVARGRFGHPLVMSGRQRVRIDDSAATRAFKASPSQFLLELMLRKGKGRDARPRRKEGAKRRRYGGCAGRAGERLMETVDMSWAKPGETQEVRRLRRKQRIGSAGKATIQKNA